VAEPASASGPAGDRATDLAAARREVEAVNTAFYESIEAGDLDTMTDLWLDDPETVCVHPGAGPVRGASAIRRSWAMVMASTAYIQFFLTDVEVGLRGGIASVTCTENVLTGDHRTGPDAFGGGAAVATNVFVRTPDGWRLWVHHASPVLSAGDDDH
jgi:ketosteroid isomerase-like protein